MLQRSAFRGSLGLASAAPVRPRPQVVMPVGPPYSPLIQAAEAHTTSSPITVNFPAPTTAGNLLVAAIGSNINVTNLTMDPGWVLLASEIEGGGPSSTSIWTYPNAPSLTSVTAQTTIANNFDIVIAEFEGVPAAPSVTLVGTLEGDVPDGTVMTATSAATGDGLTLLSWNARYGEKMEDNATGFTDVTAGSGVVSGNLQSLGFRTMTAGQTVSTALSPGTPIADNVFLMAYVI